MLMQRFAEQPGRPIVGTRIDPNADVLAAPMEEEDDVRSEVAAVMSELLPWGISVLLHVALVLLAIFIVWSVQTVMEEEDVIIPSVTLSDTPGAPLTMQQTQKIQSQASSQQRTITKTETQTVSPVETKQTTDIQLIGAAGGPSSKSSPFSGLGNANGPFSASLYGSGGNAKRIAYVVDASGSLIDTLPFVIEELKESIRKLSDQQSFTVIFFSDGKVIQPPRTGLLEANKDVRDQVQAWLDSGAVTAQGTTAPLEAVKKALSYRPQLVFLLSDNITGRQKYELERETLIAELMQANTGGAKINTIQFIYPDPLEKAGLKPTLKELSDKTGGVYKFVDAA